MKLWTNFLATIQNAPHLLLAADLVLPHCVNLLENLLCPEWYMPINSWASMARVGVSIKLPGYEMVCTLVMIPEPRGQPLGVVEQLRHREGHLGHPQVLSSKITAPSECGSVQQLLSQWAAHDSLPTHWQVAPPSSSRAGLGLL